MYVLEIKPYPLDDSLPQVKIPVVVYAPQPAPTVFIQQMPAGFNPQHMGATMVNLPQPSAPMMPQAPSGGMVVHACVCLVSCASSDYHKTLPFLCESSYNGKNADTFVSVIVSKILRDLCE